MNRIAASLVAALATGAIAVSPAPLRAAEGVSADQVTFAQVVCGDLAPRWCAGI